MGPKRFSKMTKHNMQFFLNFKQALKESGKIDKFVKLYNV